MVGAAANAEASLGPGSSLSAAAAAWANALVDGSRWRHRSGVISGDASTSAPSLPRFLALAAALAAASVLLGRLAFWVISLTREMSSSSSRDGGLGKGKKKRKSGEQSCPGGVCPLPSLSKAPSLAPPAAAAAASAPRRPPPPTLEAPLDGIGGGGGRRMSAESAAAGGGGAFVVAVAGASDDDEEEGGGGGGGSGR